MHGFTVRLDDDARPSSARGYPQPVPESSVQLASDNCRLLRRPLNVRKIDVPPILAFHHFVDEIARAPKRRGWDAMA